MAKVKLTAENGRFQMNGADFHIYSGAMHYFRIPQAYWHDRLLKLKLAGFNTVETYVCWNLHEPSPGKFDFSGMLDIEKYIQTAAALGLYVIVRPGPYICAEWDFGGLPAWLLQDKNMRVRCYWRPYLDAVERFFRVLFEKLKPYLSTNGGPVIAMQIENEYGSYGNDKKYLNYLKNLYEKLGMDVLLFTSDGNNDTMLSGGALPGVLKTFNFGSGSRVAFSFLKKYDEILPKMCMEFWCGWFDYWGGKHHTRGAEQTAFEIKGFLEQDASFNIYMFHGGTNFGFTSGSNYHKTFQPTVTSYDYSALLNEHGGYTPAYHKVRELLLKKQGIAPQPLPAEIPCQYIGTVQLKESTSLFDNLENIAEKHFSPLPESMEHYGQNFGLIYYKTVVRGRYPRTTYHVADVHDRAFVYVNGKKSATIDRILENKKKFFKSLYSDTFEVPAFNGECEVGVLVDTLGRVNYGRKMYDRKGISSVYSSTQALMDFDVYTIPLDNLDRLDWSKSARSGPLFLRGHFDAAPGKDAFVNVSGFTKGAVWVNGFNLGRYWNIGPSKTLYLPAPLLKENGNELIILEMEDTGARSLVITDKPNLG